MCFITNSLKILSEHDHKCVALNVVFATSPALIYLSVEVRCDLVLGEHWEPDVFLMYNTLSMFTENLNFSLKTACIYWSFEKYIYKFFSYYVG